MKTYKELKEAVGGFGSHYSRSEKHAEIGADHDDDYKPSRPAQQHKIYHKVAFKDKDAAKAEGMRYDGDKKKWYHTSAHKSNASKFVKEEVEELAESIENMSDAKVKYYAVKKIPHGRYSSNEIKSEHERRKKAVPNYHTVQPSLSEEVEELDEIKLVTVGKIIKHSPKIVSAAVGAAVAAHSTEPPKQPVKAQTTQVAKKVQKEEVELDEVLDPSMGAGEYVKDFQKSDAPQFKGKSKEKRRIMGIAAYMAAKREKE